MAYTNNFAVLGMRHAFERDLVRRRGWQAFRKQGIIGECEVCGNDFDKVVGNQKYCPGCRVTIRREQVRRDVRRHRENRIDEPEDLPVDPWAHLMIAILQQAKAEGDQEFLDEFGELFQVAILGRRLDD